MALEMVLSEGRGREVPLARNSGTASLMLVAATNPLTGSPRRLAMSPAVRLPKLPLGVQNTRSRSEGGSCAQAPK